LIPSFQPPVVDLSQANSFPAWLARLREQLPRYIQYVHDYLSQQVLPLLNAQIDTHFLGYASAAPVSGTYQVADYYVNSVPASGAPEGWVCIAAGSPGTWRTKGIIGDT
jgi:hypothetical protein